MTCSSNTTCTPDLRRGATGVLAAVIAVAGLFALPPDGSRAQAASQAREFPAANAVAGLRERARAAMASGDLRSAGNALNRALELAPLDAELWVDVARFRYRGGEHVLAIEAADRALAFAPDNPAALRLKAEFVRDRTGPLPALAWFERALERAPDDLALKADYAATLGEAGGARDMLAVTREILESDPRNARAFYLQAVLAARAGNYGLARRLLGRTGGALDKLPGVMLLRGIVEIDAQNYELAIESLEALSGAQPGNRRARDLLARAMFLSGDYAHLVDRFGDAASQEDASAYLTMTVARAYEQLDRRDRAAPLLDRIAKGQTSVVVPIAGQGPVGRMLAANDTSGARALVDEWLLANSGNFDHLALAGDVELAAGNAIGAMDYYARASRIRSPESLMVRRFQAMLLAGQTSAAYRLAHDWLAGNPQSPGAQKAWAWFAAGAGDWPRARRIYESLEAGSSGRDVRLLADLALVQVKSGDPQIGVETAKRAQAIYRAEPQSAQALALALIAAGEKPRSASALLAKARTMLGDNPLLVEARTVLAASRPSG